jgi:regulator of RNase E activity RraA
MASNRDPMKQVEGRWDEVVRHSDQFVGRIVRVIVLSEDASPAPSMLAEVRRWLAEGDALDIVPPGNVRSNVFGDALVEKFRKQGLVL